MAPTATQETAAATTAFHNFMLLSSVGWESGLRPFVDTVEDHVAALPQPPARLQDELVANRLGFGGRLRFGRLHAARALLVALILRHGGNRDEEALRLELRDIGPDLVGGHRAF